MIKHTSKNQLCCKDLEKITSFICMIRQDHDINRLIEKLESKGRLILIGGSIRDLVLKESWPRDLDIVIQTPCTNFDNEVSGLNWTKNSFGGYKVKFKQIEIDFWSIYSSWAFKEGLIDPLYQNITNSSFFNIDSIWLSLQDKEWGGYLFDSLSHRTLDIVVPDKYVEKNPSRDLNVLRAFYLSKDYGLEFSPKVLSYIKSWLSDTEDPDATLTAAHLAHYGSYLPVSLPKNYSPQCQGLH